MNTLERWRNTFTFQPLDRLPVHTFGGWIETSARWRQEGMPEDWAQTNYFGKTGCAGTGVHLGTNGFSPFFPRFTPQPLEETLTHRIFRDEHGRVVKQAKGEVNVSIVQHLEFPLKSRADWPRLQERLDPAVAVRYADLAQCASWHGHPDRDYPVIQALSGTYRLLWHLFGDEGMAYIFYDDPALVHEIMQQWLALNIGAIDRIMAQLDINVLTIMEDMSGNRGMLISPTMFREFMLPYYQALIRHVRQYPSIFGIWVDSDGDVTDLIPLLLEAGVNGLFPFEVQAGMDVVRLRAQYGDQLVIRGGIDKRVLPLGKDAIDRELDRVLPTFVKTGGYFICLDHQAPPDVSLENYQYFLEQAKSYR